MSNIAIVPARSGSKGIKDKNIKLLNGKPLIAYTIDAAIKSNCFDVIFVSTDSEKYARIARKYGAEVPFLRSKINSKDQSSSWDVVKETLEEYEKRGEKFDTFMLLQPTSPLRTKNNIREAFKLYKQKRANAIVSICEDKHSPETSYEFNKQFNISKVFVEHKDKRRQDFKKRYRINGAIYLANVDYFMNEKNIYYKKCYGYLMDEKRSIDIDDEIDFALAEVLIKK